jgi:ClpP class serine protease
LAALKQISREPKVKAIVVRVNSPGGSALMSDTIWRWIRVNQNLGKKVYFSLGNIAASGGYYIAAPADLIVAQPGSLLSLSLSSHSSFPSPLLHSTNFNSIYSHAGTITGSIGGIYCDCYNFICE